MKQVYEAIVTSQGGRAGHVKSNDGILDLDVSLPKSLGGNEKLTNPEQLFAAGYAACFESALTYVAGQRKVSAEGSKVEAHVGLSMGDNGFGLNVRLVVSLPKLERSIAQSVIDDAHKTCPYSKATKGNIEVKIELA